jgi:hypothetical protein
VIKERRAHRGRAATAGRSWSTPGASRPPDESARRRTENLPARPALHRQRLTVRSGDHLASASPTRAPERLHRTPSWSQHTRGAAGAVHPPTPRRLHLLGVPVSAAQQRHDPARARMKTEHQTPNRVLDPPGSLSCLPWLVIRLIIQTIRQDRS